MAGLAEKIEATAEALVEDAEAMKANARLERVTDLTWDEKDGAIGKYLARAREAYLDSPEGHDWEALHDFASMVMPAVIRGAVGPKAPGQARIRRLR
jgi:hypothetical protein